ncbi:MAG TPA: glycosyltransferase family 39 protein [Candidatus Binatia bacterium]
MSRAEKIADSSDARSSGDLLQYWLTWLLTAVVAFVLLYRLGGAALFEPDEGRNAEKAREILLLGDWVTPHENFYPVLDKPIFFYWLIALSYKLFGVSEWSARLPSLSAALGCVLLIYFFSRAHWGRWVALWSTLILVTTVEFFILARIVIFDMLLIFFQTVALLAFYEAAHTENRRRRGALCLALYVALGAGTLVKGMIAFVIPGIVFFLFILLRGGWQILRRIYFIPGAAVFLAVVLPWYVQADARNQGYLIYYLWAEHFGRYTGTFDRSEPWYYFIVVTLVGFFPWSLILPWIIKHFWRRSWDDKTLYLMLWVCVPLLFFSASHSKLPHYILPIFPALSIMTGATLVGLYEQSASKLRAAIISVWVVQSLNAIYLLLGFFYPVILAPKIRGRFSDVPHVLWLYAMISLLSLVYMARGRRTQDRMPQGVIYLVQAVALGIFFVFLADVMISTASARSAKPTAMAVLSHLRGGEQVAFFETYLSGLPFYLDAKRPVWLITHENKKRTFLGNYHANVKRLDPLTPWGEAIFNLDDFGQQWKSRRQPFLVIVKDKNLPQLAETIGQAPKPLGHIGEYVLVSNR